MFKDKQAREDIERLNARLTDGFNYQYKRMKELDNKLNLLLHHLKLKHVPETEKKEPAKLVEKKDDFLLGTGCFVGEFNGFKYHQPGKPPLKPKRKYTKRKKSK